MDSSSAFNTIQPDLLFQRLLDLNVCHSNILNVRQFLSDRPQRVNFGGVTSEELVLNTGVPQGSVLTPILSSMCTNEMSINNVGLRLVA